MKVGGAARRKTYDPAYRPRRVGLRPRDPRQRQQRGSVHGQMQKISAGKFHFQPPSHHSITSSAMASTPGGTVRPSLVAVLRLMTNSNLVGCSTGKSAGLAPFSILST